MLDLAGTGEDLPPRHGERGCGPSRGWTCGWEEGSFVVVIGTNGSGKSTLQNAVSGSFLVDRGAHRPGGARHHPLAGAPEGLPWWGGCSRTPSAGTAPSMSVGENLALALRRGPTAHPGAQRLPAPPGGPGGAGAAFGYGAGGPAGQRDRLSLRGAAAGPHPPHGHPTPPGAAAAGTSTPPPWTRGRRTASSASPTTWCGRGGSPPSW